MRGSPVLSVAERQRLYPVVMAFHSLGWGADRIARQLGMPKTTVTNWLYYGKAPRRFHLGSGKAHRLDITPSPELSYLFGAFLSDGTIAQQNRSRKIGLIAKDIEFVKAFAQCAARVIQRQALPAVGEHYCKYLGKPYLMYQCQVYSRELAWLLLNFDSMKPLIEEHPTDFLRGFADGDGSVYHNGKNKSVRLYNNKQSLIEYCQHLLAQLNIYSHIHQRKDGSNQVELIIERIEDIKKWRNLIGFIIQRKQQKLDEIIDYFSKKVSEE